MAELDTTPSGPTGSRRGRPRKTRAAALPSCIPRLEPSARMVVEMAVRALEESAVYRTELMNSPRDAGLYLKLRLAPLDHEEFHIIWLDNQNRMIVAERMFSGTLSSTAVYPREVVKAALHHNAAACILGHNHPSGDPRPSDSDIALTKRLVESLNAIDVRVLDHLIIAGNCAPISLLEYGVM